MSKEVFEVFNSEGKLQMSADWVGSPLRVAREISLASVRWSRAPALGVYIGDISISVDLRHELLAVELIDGVSYGIALSGWREGGASFWLSSDTNSHAASRLVVLSTARRASNPTYGLELYNSDGGLVYTAHDHTVDLLGVMEKPAGTNAPASRTFPLKVGKRRLALMTLAMGGRLKSPSHPGSILFGNIVGMSGSTVYLGVAPIRASSSDQPGGEFFDSQAVIAEINS